MDDSILYYSIKLKSNGSFWAFQNYPNELGWNGADYQIAFKQVSLRNDNGLFDLLLYKGVEEVDHYEFNGWEIKNIHYSFSWGKSTIKAELKDCINETQEMVLVSVEAGSRSNWVPSPEWLLKEAFGNIQKITKTYGSIEMYNLCEHSLTQLLHRKESFYYFNAVKNVSCYSSDCIFFDLMKNEM